MYDKPVSPPSTFSNAFTCSSKITLTNIRKGLVKVTFPLHLQYLHCIEQFQLDSSVLFIVHFVTLANDVTELTLPEDGC